MVGFLSGSKGRGADREILLTGTIIGDRRFTAIGYFPHPQPLSQRRERGEEGLGLPWPAYIDEVK
jgi:hypothetical protein